MAGGRQFAATPPTHFSAALGVVTKRKPRQEAKPNHSLRRALGENTKRGINIMPYQTTWVAAKKDPNIKCYAILPDGYEVASGLFACYQLASKDGTRCAMPENALHFCEKCGWVEGYPNQYKVNTLDSAHLSGQRGEDYHCARCGNHIGFSGVMS